MEGVGEVGEGKPVIGLALSGGGSRAIAFHLGCLRALHHRGILEKVRVFSSVSGGSVIAAAYAYSTCGFSEFDARMVANLRRGFQTRIFLASVASREAPKILFTLLVTGGATLLLSSVRRLVALVRFATRLPTEAVEAWFQQLSGHLPYLGSMTTAFEHVLRRDLFGGVGMNETGRAGLDVVINACDLRTGTAFRFGNGAAGGWRYGCVDGGQAVPVAKAVAASAAFPLLLPPLREKFAFLRGDRRIEDTVVLTDGGVFDNLGVSVLEPGRSADVSIHVPSSNFIICLNAGAGQLEGSDTPIWWTSRVKRSFQTIHRKAQDAAYGRLHRYSETGELKGFIMVYLGQVDERLPVQPPDLVPRDAVRDYPTDFAPMSERSIELLTKRGRQLTELLLDRYAPHL